MQMVPLFSIEKTENVNVHQKENGIRFVIHSYSGILFSENEWTRAIHIYRDKFHRNNDKWNFTEYIQ